MGAVFSVIVAVLGCLGQGIILTLKLLAKGVLALVGFGSIGITAGSWAARFMARMAVNGVTTAGGCVACLQHFTMT